MASDSGKNDRAQQRLDLGDAGNVIPFPSRQRETPAERPEFAEAIDIILTTLDDPEAHSSPLAGDLAATTLVAMLRSAAGEPHALGPPNSVADIGPEPSKQQLSASSHQLVATLVDLVWEVPVEWPDPPDARTAVDALYALSLAGGPLAGPARAAVADHGFQPSPNLEHFNTAEVTSAYEITYDHDESFELVFELRYPTLGDDAPRPAYPVNFTTSDGPNPADPMVTAVHGAEDITELLARLTEVVNSPDPDAPVIDYRPIDVATALATLNRGLERFTTRLLRRSGLEPDNIMAVAVDHADQPDRRSSEPFDPAGIPEALVERAGAIAGQASSLAVAIFDEEFATLVRRFTAACARHRECPLGRGTPTTSATTGSTASWWKSSSSTGRHGSTARGRCWTGPWPDRPRTAVGFGATGSC